MYTWSHYRHRELFEDYLSDDRRPLVAAHGKIIEQLTTTRLGRVAARSLACPFLLLLMVPRAQSGVLFFNASATPTCRNRLASPRHRAPASGTPLDAETRSKSSAVTKDTRPAWRAPASVVKIKSGSRKGYGSSTKSDAGR